MTFLNLKNVKVLHGLKMCSCTVIHILRSADTNIINYFGSVSRYLLTRRSSDCQAHARRDMITFMQNFEGDAYKERANIKHNIYCH